MSFHQPRTLLYIAALSLVAKSATSATVDYPPTGIYSSTISANASPSGDVWTGVAQSFTALDVKIVFGFYLFKDSPADSAVQYTLYSGDGQFATVLSQKVITLTSGTFFNPTLLTVDFSDSALTVGEKYTVALSSPSFALPAAGSYNNVSIRYAGLSLAGNPNPYSDGTFYYTGSDYPPTRFFDRDIAFRVTAAPIPEPSSKLLLGTGAMTITLLARRRRCTSKSSDA